MKQSGVLVVFAVSVLAGLLLALRLNKPTVQGESLGGGDWGGLTVLTLKHFQPWEFRTWFADMSPELLTKLDKFRELWGQPVAISSHADGLGRHLGSSDTSQHNVDKWGEVRAVDVFPQGLNAQTKAFAIQCAKRAGFTGYGLYSDTSPGWMMHLDVRSDRSAVNPATWARVGGNYVGIEVV